MRAIDPRGRARALPAGRLMRLSRSGAVAVGSDVPALYGPRRRKEPGACHKHRAPFRRRARLGGSLVAPTPECAQRNEECLYRAEGQSPAPVPERRALFPSEEGRDRIAASSRAGINPIPGTVLTLREKVPPADAERT